MTKARKRRQTSGGLPIPVLFGGLLGLLLIGFGLITLTARQGSTASSALPNPEVVRISPTEAYDEQQAGKGVLVDVRAAQFYQESHAAGAISFPEDDLAANLNSLPTDKTLILYCT
jgi:hypothetical protein